MTNLVEGMHSFEFVASEANGSRSRDNIVLASGNKCNAGDVLGKILDGTATPAAGAGNTGLGVLGPVTLSQGAISGVYTLTAILAGATGKLILEDPNGAQIGIVTVGTLFTGGGLSFTLADNATHLAVGDTYTITVAVGSLKYVPISQTAIDGSQHAAAILGINTDATSADKNTVAIVRSAEVNLGEISFGSLDAGHIATAKTELAALGIIVRGAV
jgi:hypothetical protein